MKGRYINTKILLACLSKKSNVSKDIKSEVKETIAEHRRIMRQFVTQTTGETYGGVEMYYTDFFE